MRRREHARQEKERQAIIGTRFQSSTPRSGAFSGTT
jgi:hypothetical protein